MMVSLLPGLKTEGFHSAALAIMTLEAPVSLQNSLIPSWVLEALSRLLLEPPLAITGIRSLTASTTLWKGVNLMDHFDNSSQRDFGKVFWFKGPNIEITT